MLYLPKTDSGQFFVSCALMLLPFSLCMLLSLALVGPSVGTVFSNIVQSL
jgi:hypothetical protein